MTALINNPALGAGPVAASGDGWTCIGTTCTRSDVLAPGAAYPAIRITVNVANSAAATLANAVTVTGGGDAAGGSARWSVSFIMSSIYAGTDRGELAVELGDAFVCQSRSIARISAG